ncbi:MAG: DAK2 domain-containing protein, partial [Mycobacterium sp.]|uniref:DAK2 domain-containing protein n=1 Tax=Mycobacterium sp. TaxID=1785 RepID=UPI001ED63762
MGSSDRRLDAAALRDWAHTAVSDLITHIDEINRLNVFPVADSDTGANMLFTMRSALAQVGSAASSGAGSSNVVQVAAALSAGALNGARGNSGVILSQILRGFAESLDSDTTAGPADLAGALAVADRLATAAVSEPVAGTMLTVLHAAACAAEDDRYRPLAEQLHAVAESAGRALADTPRQLAVLSRAGVVDAGAQG